MEASNKGIKPYISKRKRNAETQSSSVIHQKRSNIKEDDHVKKLFITDETVLRYSESKADTNFLPRSILKSAPIISSPLWSTKWCKKFSHLIACTAEYSLQLLDVMKKDVPYCVHTSSHHSGFLRDVAWSRTCRQVATCSFDKTVKICDFMKDGEMSVSINLPKIPTVVRWVPHSDETIIVGGHEGFLACYDLRSGKKVVSYDSQCGNVVALEMFQNRSWFVTAGDAVSRQSPEHSLIIWDIVTGAKLSNQIFHERYSCPSVCVHPSETMFLAQTNGNYIARFKAQHPFSLDKYMRYEQHCVAGYPVGFDLSPDGTIVVSGSSDANVVFYKYTNGKFLKSISVPRLSRHNKSESNSIISVQWHPVLPSMLAVSDWSGQLHILR